jgi:2-polyprenyl-3-methyl-5-hydroxy-6-metoxy-1,4-benzoquinol methylase
MKVNKKHWENIYATKGMQEVSWYQKSPQTSLNLISQLQLSKNASIIDIGAGDSFLVDELLKLGYTNISVLDISVNAIKRAKKRLGELAKNVKWIVTDITEFNPTEKYDLWHDRAVFHFLTQEKDINIYKKLVDSTISGYFLLSTFSDEGPDKCSGLEICKYSELDLKNQFEGHFTLIDSFKKDHNTPFETIQNFTFSLFKRING